MKKVISLILAIIAVFSLTVPAFAAYYPTVSAEYYISKETGKSCSKDDPNAVKKYEIYDKIYLYKTFWHTEKEWNAMSEYEQKSECFNRLYGSLEDAGNKQNYPVYVNICSANSSDKFAKYTPQSKVITIKNKDELLNYDKWLTEVENMGKQYTAENGYNVIGGNYYFHDYYSILEIVYENDFTTSDNTSGGSAGEESPSDEPASVSFFTSFINVIKNFFNLILSVFKK